jgi:hypothetical protein
VVAIPVKFLVRKLAATVVAVGAIAAVNADFANERCPTAILDVRTPDVVDAAVRLQRELSTKEAP